MGCIKNKEVEEIDVFSRKRREKTRLKSWIHCWPTRKALRKALRKIY